MIVYAIVDDSLSPTSPLGDAIETFIRREGAERFIEEVRGDDSELAKRLRIEERELEAGPGGTRTTEGWWRGGCEGYSASHQFSADRNMLKGLRATFRRLVLWAAITTNW